MARTPITRDDLPERMEAIAARDPGWSHHLVAMDLWADLTKAMADQGLTQVQLAERAGLKQSYVSRALSNPERISFRTAARLCHALGLELVVRARPKAETLPDKPAQRPRRQPSAQRQSARRAVVTP
ncbi:MAG: helix-turn-helix domain-containing protein [Armatimonadetes bacterium]|nr:helix-turn-helix domain-containing protein [Armatimonadota bacterium]